METKFERRNFEFGFCPLVCMVIGRVRRDAGSPTLVVLWAISVGLIINLHALMTLPTSCFYHNDIRFGLFQADLCHLLERLEITKSRSSNPPLQPIIYLNG